MRLLLRHTGFLRGYCAVGSRALRGLMLALFVGVSLFGQVSEMRIWTRAEDGQQIRARFESVSSEGVVNLRLESGRRFRAVLSVLSEEDQRYVQKRGRRLTFGQIGERGAGDVRGPGVYQLTFQEADPNDPVIASVSSRSPVMKEEESPPGLDRASHGFREVDYFRVPIAGKPVLLAMDPSSRPRVIVDTDRDGSLERERTFAGRTISGTPPSRFGGRYSFGPVKIAPAEEDGQLIECQIIQYYDYIVPAPVGYYRAKVDVNGLEYSIAVMDADLDGRCAPAGGSGELGGTILALDKDRDRRFSGYLMGVESEIQPLCEFFFIDGTYCRVEAAGDFSSIRLAETKPEFGALDIETRGTVSVVSPTCCLSAETDSNGLVRLPPGTYSVTGVKLEDQGWTLQTSGSSGRLSRVDIVPGETARVAAGPPFVCKTTASTMGNTVYIGFALAGRAGETYGAVYRGGRRQPAPKFRIANREGRQVGRGQFEYG